MAPFHPDLTAIATGRAPVQHAPDLMPGSAESAHEKSTIEFPAVK
jgi:hypothetical protein